MKFKIGGGISSVEQQTKAQNAARLNAAAAKLVHERGDDRRGVVAFEEGSMHQVDSQDADGLLLQLR